MDRRSFLRALIATAVATQLPSLPKAQAARLADSLEEKLSRVILNGHPPRTIKIKPVSNDWYKVDLAFPLGGQDGSMSFDMSSINAGKGIFVGDPASVEKHLQEHPEEVCAYELTIPVGHTAPEDQERWSHNLSMYVKAKQDNLSAMYLPQLTADIRGK